MMKNFLLLSLLLVSGALHAAEINFLDNPKWTTVLERAKKENKIIFLDAYATWCGPCKQMDAETYTNEAVASFYNANFINVKYDMEKGEGPILADRYYVSAYPNLVFISPDGIMLHKGVGFLAATTFLELGQTAKNPNTQYFTLKKKALNLSNADFLSFSKQALAVQDEDYGQISRDFLATKTDLLGDNDLIELIMEYAFALPKETDLAYFKQNKSKVVKDGKYKEEDFDQRLISLAMQFALSEEVQVTDELDFDAVKGVLEKFIPKQAFFVFHYFKTQYLLENKELDAAFKTFDEILNNANQVSYEQLANAMMAFGPTLYEEGKLEPFLLKFDKIGVANKDMPVSYLKDFAKAIVYIKTKQVDKFKETANLMLSSDNTPQDVKRDLKLALQNMSN